MGSSCKPEGFCWEEWNHCVTSKIHNPLQQSTKNSQQSPKIWKVIFSEVTQSSLKVNCQVIWTSSGDEVIKPERVNHHFHYLLKCLQISQTRKNPGLSLRPSKTVFESVSCTCSLKNLGKAFFLPLSQMYLCLVGMFSEMEKKALLNHQVLRRLSAVEDTQCTLQLKQIIEYNLLRM